jgi:hypothetical protein
MVNCKALLLCFVSALSIGCNGSSSNDGIVFQGQLTQGDAVAHAEATSKHGAGQNIENVEVCALGECSTTDDGGNWAFVAPEVFTGGSVEFTLNGHGLQTNVLVDVPEGSRDVFAHFERQGGNTVVVHHLMIDGVRQ